MKLYILILTMVYSMFGFGNEKKTINVQFIENGETTPFAISDMPIEQLPETFQINTNLNIGENEWTIISATPLTKVGFRKTGKLILVLQKYKIEQINPQDILYSLPTISNDIAGVEKPQTLKNIIAFAEDDWRQFEVISIAFKDYIENDLDGIRNIYETNEPQVGFKNLYLRKDIVQPLRDTNISLETIKKQFTLNHVYSGVVFNNAAATIVGGFAFSTQSGWVLWGQKDVNGIILFLNIFPSKDASFKSFGDEMDRFLKANNTYIVNWPKMFWAGGKKASFKKYSKYL